MIKKSWKITVKRGFIRTLLKELDHWCVDKFHYIVSGDEIVTSDANVVDVATETFINCQYLLVIEEVKQNESKEG